METYYYTTCDSPVGKLFLAGKEDSLNGLWIEGQKYFGSGILKDAALNPGLAVFKKTEEWLGKYFNGEKPEIGSLPVFPCGSLFRQTVWELLCEIPYGQVVTYGEIAKRTAAKMGRDSMSAQAVGGAVGHNPISIIIPCHRVVGADGSMTGYAAGIIVKEKLLKLEGAELCSAVKKEEIK